jgi:16S rRNA (cytidine1402-2'-O)-methyltransferase
MSVYNKNNEHIQVKNIIEQLKSGMQIALISDSGTPAISDPGFLLVRECLKNEIEIECLPGATAFVPALVESGFPCDEFLFIGFLPHKKGRQTALKKLAEENRTFILYESPNRLVRLLEELIEICGAERNASVSREMTKLFAEKKRGTLSEMHDYFSRKEVKGEIVVLVKAKD